MYDGQRCGLLRLIIARSAFLPVFIEPISFSHDKAFAPSMVAISKTCCAGIRVGFLFTPLCRMAVVFMGSNMSTVLFEHGLSVPSARALANYSSVMHCDYGSVLDENVHFCSLLLLL